MSLFTASRRAGAIGEPLPVTKPTGVELNWLRNLVFGTCAASYLRLRVGPKYTSIFPFARPSQIGALSAKYCTAYGRLPLAAHLALSFSRICWKVDPGLVARVRPHRSVMSETCFRSLLEGA